MDSVESIGAMLVELIETRGECEYYRRQNAQCIKERDEAIRVIIQFYN
jgi:hypothetical protein